MKIIKLTKNKVAFVDNIDYEYLSRFKWFARCKRNTYYAMRKIKIDGKQYQERMHRRILGLKKDDGKYVDHKDCNGLNNQRSNIRIAINAENQRNREKPNNNTSGFKGVRWHKIGRKWQAQIYVNYKHISLGLFHSPLVAALAYNLAAIEYFGEFARPNQID